LNFLFSWKGLGDHRLWHDVVPSKNGLKTPSKNKNT
jgi:hypothetical protein